MLGSHVEFLENTIENLEQALGDTTAFLNRQSESYREIANRNQEMIERLLMNYIAVIEALELLVDPLDPVSSVRNLNFGIRAMRFAIEDHLKCQRNGGLGALAVKHFPDIQAKYITHN